MSASEKNKIERRDFIKATAAMISGVISAAIAIPSIAYFLAPALEEVEDTDSIALGPLENYPIGVPTRFDFTRTRVNGWERTATNYGLYVYRKNEQEVHVFSDICTHLGCKVTWHEDQKHYISPCHDGHFDIDGSVVSGPPPRPLDIYAARIEDGELFVQLPAIKRQV
jgi:menaquinol-cytochrome c reductase iron-sulfur subunit